MFGDDNPAGTQIVNDTVLRLGGVFFISHPRHRNIDIGMPSADVEKLFGNCYRSEEMTIGSLKLVIFHKVAIFHHFADDPK